MRLSGMAVLGAAASLAALCVGGARVRPAAPPDEIRVVVVAFFPTDGANIDIRATGDWGRPYEETRRKCDRMTRETVAALEEGSRFRGFSSPAAPPALRYRVVRSLEFRKPLPVLPPPPGAKVGMTNYRQIMEEIGIRDLVLREGVKEVWIWGYHGGVLGLWESNMASPTGDISNSDRNPNDLPILSKTYTVYHYNYQRDVGEAVEDHTHQFEALLNAVDGRDRTPQADWPGLFFWGRFVGSDTSHRIVTRPARCGWTHYPPNAERDYDWANKRFVESDIEDWRPDSPGRTRPVNCDLWGCDGLRWKILWMQSLAGPNSGLTFRGKPLTNWWSLVSDWDRVRRDRTTLVSR